MNFGFRVYAFRANPHVAEVWTLTCLSTFPGNQTLTSGDGMRGGQRDEGLGLLAKHQCKIPDSSRNPRSKTLNFLSPSRVCWATYHLDRYSPTKLRCWHLGGHIVGFPWPEDGGRREGEGEGERQALTAGIGGGGRGGVWRNSGLRDSSVKIRALKPKP